MQSISILMPKKKSTKSARSTVAVTYLTQGKLIALIADEDTVVGFLMGGIGEKNKERQTNFMIVDENTTVPQIIAEFESFYKRGDIDIILIGQVYADMIRNVLEDHTEVIPTVLEIPTKYSDYDPSKDTILKRAKGMFSKEDFR